MQTGQHQSSHHGCGSQSSGPEVYYGYCHDTRRMRMMNYADYVNNAQTTYSNLASNPTSAMQMLLDALSGIAGSTSPSTSMPTTHARHHKHGCGCHEQDCACECCIRCADIVEYARCGEVRQIPLVFDNDTRRERDVTLLLGNFATESGQDAGWKAAVSPTTFKLAPCGETTVVLSVNVDCSKLGTPAAAGTAASNRQASTVDSCKVVYATLTAEGCTVRPLVIAVAVLPGFCGAHRAGCGCGCCN
jgi:hypothetical protein